MNTRTNKSTYPCGYVLLLVPASRWPDSKANDELLHKKSIPKSPYQSSSSLPNRQAAALFVIFFKSKRLDDNALAI